MRGVLGSALPGGEAAADTPERTFEAALHAVRRRLRVQRAIDAGATFALAGLGSAALALCAWKTTHDRAALFGLGVAAFAPFLGALIGGLRPLSARIAAQRIDRALASADLFASASSFLELSPALRTRFMRACIDAAERASIRVQPSTCAPWRRPRALVPALCAAAGLCALSWLELPKPRAAAPHPAPKLRLLESEDIEAARAAIAPLVRAQTSDPELGSAARELNALVEALRDGTIDRARALRELRELERRVQGLDAGEDQSTLREALAALGQNLEHEALAASLAEAMRAGDVERTRAELDQLAQALAEARAKQAERSLARALNRAAQVRASKPNPELARARAERERLLHKKSRDERKSDPEAQRLLHKNQRELDRLEREEASRQEQERELDQLKRELGGAGSSLASGRRGEAGQHLERGEKSLENAAGRQARAEQQKKLREQLQQLRELISKQKGQGRSEGERSEPSSPSKQGGVQRLQLSEFGRNARGQPSSPEAAPDGSPRGSARAPGAPNGEPEGTLLGPGTGDGNQRFEVESEASPSATGSTEGGKPQRGAPQKSLETERVDTRVSGQAAPGATRSQIIREAGQHGFAARGYERVHADYERHAEAVIERDHVPGGYRFYVRRYFQLIRPREGTP